MRFNKIQRLAYQPDILEWATKNKATFDSIRKAREATKTSMFSIKSIMGSADKSTPNSDSTELKETSKAEQDPQEPKLGESLMQQYYQSQELRNLLKWKRISWDKGVDYEGFSSRLIDAAKMFSKKRAFSFLGVHIIKDEAAHRMDKLLGVPEEPHVPIALHEITEGALSSWYTKEPEVIKRNEKREVEKTSVYHRKGSFSLSWETGQVKMLDSISLQEMVYFLDHYALRAQQTQLRIEEEQTTLNEAIENVRFRCTLDALKFNEDDQAIISQGVKGKNVLSSEQVMQFCQGMLKTAWLYRKHFQGHQVRIGYPGTGYIVSEEKKELTIPCDFDRFSWMAHHQAYLRHEGIANSYRNHWYVWLFVATFFFADLDIV